MVCAASSPVGAIPAAIVARMIETTRLSSWRSIGRPASAARADRVVSLPWLVSTYSARAWRGSSGEAAAKSESPRLALVADSAVAESLRPGALVQQAIEEPPELVSL